MKTAKKQGTISGVRFGKQGIGITLTNGTVVPISEQLLSSIAKGIGCANLQSFCRIAAGCSITYDEVQVEVGDSLGRNRKGELILNTNKNSPMYGTNFYGTAHTRYNNITIAMSQQALMLQLQADAYGTALANMLVQANAGLPKASELPAVPTEGTEVAESAEVQEPELVQEPETPVMEESAPTAPAGF